jgi:phosphoglycerate dehydrogenase-like enzyme
MKIAVIASKDRRNSVFTEKGLRMLRELGEVVLNEGEADLESVKATIKDADVAITSWGNTTLTAEILDEAPNLKLVFHAAGSVKPIVSDEIWKRGIRVCASTKPLGEGVAETALGFAISASKNFYQLNDDIHNGGYNENLKNVRELYELKFGVVSAGFVGRHLIKLLGAFGVDVLLYDPYVSEEKAAAMGCRKAELCDLMENEIKSVDIIDGKVTLPIKNFEIITLKFEEMI